MLNETTTQTAGDKDGHWLLDGMLRRDREHLARLRADLEIERESTSALIESFEAEIEALAADIDAREAARERAAQEAACAGAAPVSARERGPSPLALGLLSVGFAVASLVAWMTTPKK